MKSYNTFQDEILVASAVVFSKFGFKKTTMDEIAKAVRKGKSSIYYYFKSKEDIFQAIIEKESQLLNDELTKATSKENSAKDKIRVYFLTRTKMLQHFANLHTTLTDEYYERYNFIEKVREKYHQQEIDSMKSILNEGRKSGDFKIKDLKITAFAIITALRGLEYPWATAKDIKALNKEIHILLEILFNGNSTK